MKLNFERFDYVFLIWFSVKFSLVSNSKVGADSCASLSSIDIFEPQHKESYNKMRYDHDQVGKSVESVRMDHKAFVVGPQLLWNQTLAMIMKKFLYFIRNYFLLFSQFFLPILFIIITVLWHRNHKDDKDLRELAISFNEYTKTVTTVEKGGMVSGSLLENIAASYESIINSFPDDHMIKTTEKDFQDEILHQYKESLSDVNSKYMIGATFNASRITAWFNNQAYHTAPLAINTINNAILNLPNIPESEDEVIDSDVIDEKNRIRSISDPSEDTLVVKDLTKFYGKMLAVNQICVSVKNSECFGLLGINGAGKTSTFKMLTGDSRISSGEAWVDGISIKTNMDKIHYKIGYCPQFDALFDDLTGRETLKVFALLRGIPRNEINAVSLQFAEEFAFMKHFDKKIRTYSGGNKRKLSAALSLIGNPSVVYMDEPTSGMDVGARRQLWNMIIKARNAGRAVVLTSHSMEECEVLCTRLAIMVNGEFKCLGPTQHLKNKFSKGFFLTIKIERGSSSDNLNDPVAEVKNFVFSKFSKAILKEEYMDILTYHIPTAKVKWSEMFGLMEEAKKRLKISDYSLGQTSLEQVFLFFTKYQRISD